MVLASHKSGFELFELIQESLLMKTNSARMRIPGHMENGLISRTLSHCHKLMKY